MKMMMILNMMTMKLMEMIIIKKVQFDRFNQIKLICIIYMLICNETILAKFHIKTKNGINNFIHRLYKQNV